jgi:hypothetical protein
MDASEDILETDTETLKYSSETWVLRKEDENGNITNKASEINTRSN